MPKTAWITGIGLLVVLAVAFALAIRPPATARGLSAVNSRPAVAPEGAVAARTLRLLVIGGTSGIGLATVQLALARGHLVTSMARHAPATPLTHPRLRVVQGSIDDANAVAAALRSQDAVIISIGLPPTRQPTTVVSTGVAHVLEGMHAAGIERLLVITGIGAGNSRGHGGFGHDSVILPAILGQIYADKDRAEARVRASDRQWTIVRPGFLENSAATGRYAVVSDLEGVRSGSISRADVAQYLVEAAESGVDSRATVLLTR